MKRKINVWRKSKNKNLIFELLFILHVYVNIAKIDLEYVENLILVLILLLEK